MGWKSVKEHYRIKHIVQVRPDTGICIGSSYVGELIVIGFDGTLKKRHDSTVNEDLLRYMRAFDADPEKLKELVAAPDTFSASIPVYTYDGGTIVEKQCEEAGWPNVTHDGYLMYENTFSTDKEKVIGWAKRNAKLGVKHYRERISETEEKLARFRGLLADEESHVAKLDADYPTVEPAP